MGDPAQKLEGVPLLGDGVVLRIIHPAEHLHRGRLYLPVLALAAGLHQLAGDAHRAAGGDLQDLGFVIRQAAVGNGLQGMKERLRQLGGELNIETSPGQGFALRARVPLEGV